MAKAGKVLRKSHNEYLCEATEAEQGKPSSFSTWFWQVLKLRDRTNWYTLCLNCFGISYFRNIQLMFGMEIYISIAWGSWFWGLGCWHSWLGFLWFRFALLLRCPFRPSILARFCYVFIHIFLLSLSEILPPCDVVSKRNHFYQVPKCCLIHSLTLVHSKRTLHLNC